MLSMYSDTYIYLHRRVREANQKRHNTKYANSSMIPTTTLRLSYLKTFLTHIVHTSQLILCTFNYKLQGINTRMHAVIQKIHSNDIYRWCWIFVCSYENIRTKKQMHACGCVLIVITKFSYGAIRIKDTRLPHWF